MERKTKNKKSNLGFSLVELLVVISILGILIIIALPRLGNLKTSNQTTKYKKYAESILTSGKLYTDSNAQDMFGYNTSGCYDIPYKDLKTAGLVNNIKIDGADCSGGTNRDTFVRVKKSGDHYTYEVSILCVSKNGQELYKSLLNKDSCDGSTMDNNEPTITINPNSKDWTTGKNEYVTISVSDSYGMLENAKIKYTWTTTPDAIPESAFKTYDFKNKRYEGTPSNPLKLRISLPQSVSGIYYLVVKPADIRDVNGNYFTSTIKSGQFKLDNTPPTTPVLNNPKDNIWTGPDFVNSMQYVIGVTSSDAHSGIAYYQYRYPSSEPNWTTYANSDKTSFTTTAFLAERNENVEIRACDRLKNCSTPASSRIKIDKTKPSISSVTNSSNGAWTNSNVTITANSVDSLSGIKAIYYYYDADATLRFDWNTNNTSRVSGTWSIERDNEVFVIAEDNAGNRSDPVSANRVRIDKTKPIITKVSNSSNGIWTKGNVTISGSGTDSFSGIKAIYYYYNDDTTLRSDWNTNNVTSVSKTWSANKNNTVYLTAIDNAGNRSDPVSTGLVRIDKTKPTCSIDLSGTKNSSGKYTTNVTVSLNKSDALSGLAGYGMSSSNSVNYSGQTSLSATSNGSYTYYGFVKDNAGNTNSCSTSFTISKYYCPSGTLTYDSSEGYICIKKASSKEGLTGSYTPVPCGGGCVTASDGICGPPQEGCTSGLCWCPNYGTTYYCDSGWRDYDGSESSLRCYRAASTG